jgi:tRNA wybutosine-synthesizing protein 3
VLTAALTAGFRESGAMSLGATKSGVSTPMVAVRSAGYSFDSIIGCHDGPGRNVMMVNERYLKTLVGIANDRFRINVDRIARFRRALMGVFEPADHSADGLGKPEWEDADARKRRKREEGLARQQALQTSSTAANESSKKSQDNVDAMDGTFD